MNNDVVTPDEVRMSYALTVKTAKVRPEGYLEDVLSKEKRRSSDGKYIIMARSDYMQHLLKYSPQGFGDKVAAIAKPIARVIDNVTGTNLENCGGCKKRQDFINNITTSNK